VPNFEIDLGNDASRDRQSRRPRPSLFVRLLEASGLVLVAWGLGSLQIVPAAVGAVMILGSYAFYRRAHPHLRAAEPDRSLAGPDGDGGGD